MNINEFEEFLHKKIPLTKAMGISVLELTPNKVRLSAKLEPNMNHMATAFGGSINTLLTVCGWSIVYINISETDKDAHVVVQSSCVDYLSPINHDFIAECTINDEEDRKNLIKAYTAHGKSRIKLNVLCYDKETLAAKFEGKYVILK